MLPGQNFYATVTGWLRFVEHALAVLGDARVQRALAERNIAASISVYSPHPKTVEFMMPAIAKMLPRGTRFQSWPITARGTSRETCRRGSPCLEAGQSVGVISCVSLTG